MGNVHVLRAIESFASPAEVLESAARQLRSLDSVMLPLDARAELEAGAWALVDRARDLAALRRLAA